MHDLHKMHDHDDFVPSFGKMTFWGLVAGLINLAITLAMIAGAVWVVVWVLQQTGVL